MEQFHRFADSLIAGSRLMLPRMLSMSNVHDVNRDAESLAIRVVESITNARSEKAETGSNGTGIIRFHHVKNQEHIGLRTCHSASARTR